MVSARHIGHRPNNAFEADAVSRPERVAVSSVAGAAQHGVRFQSCLALTQLLV
jgi:hypothetical protein